MYVYHAVPPAMDGTLLYPLNAMKDVLPAQYEKQASKYEGREQLRTRRIPILDCLWNDVVFLTAVSPEAYRRARIEAGFPLARPFRCYQIALDSLEQNQLAVMTRMEINEPREYEKFNAGRFDSYARVPPETMQYWREELAAGERPFLFMHIPHILYRGSIDISVAPIVEASPA